MIEDEIVKSGVIEKEECGFQCKTVNDAGDPKPFSLYLRQRAHLHNCQRNNEVISREKKEGTESAVVGLGSKST